MEAMKQALLLLTSITSSCSRGSPNNLELAHLTTYLKTCLGRATVRGLFNSSIVLHGMFRLTQ